jgi:hypothetical protein
MDRSGMHCTSSPVLPDPACANQSPGVQLSVRATDTLKVRAQDCWALPLYWRQTRVSAAGVATLLTWQPL